MTWIRCADGKEWCPLETVNLTNVNVDGVYLIWHEGNPARVVRIGQGDIARRLTSHRQDDDILDYGRYGKLRVTWASVRSHRQDGLVLHGHLYVHIGKTALSVISPTRGLHWWGKPSLMGLQFQ